MPNIYTMPLGAYQTNTYLIWGQGSGSCCIIDPGYEAETILAQVRKLGLTVDAILLTHGHFDHVGAVQAIVEQTGCALWMSEGDWSQFPNPITHYFYPLANCDFTDVQLVEDGEVICAGGLRFSAIATPGHTHGSVCYLCRDALFSGDTLFAGSCGRTDLPGADPNSLGDSLDRLRSLDGNYTVYPGHGESTTLAWEKRYNPYMR